MSKRCYSICFFIFSLAVYSAAGADTLHILEKGETLYALSRKYSVPVAILLERNNISDAGKITVGQKIYIPETYTIQKGDTLYSIAKRFSVTVEALRKANSLSDSAVLKVGKILIVPEREKTAVAAASKNTIASANMTTTQQTSPASWEDPRSYVKKSIDKKLLWPVPISDISYLSGKLYGVAIDSTANAPVQAIASGRVISIGPHRGYGQVIFIQSKTKHVYVYGGLAQILPQAGAHITVGQKLGTLAADSLTGTPRLYFMVYSNNKPLDPAKAPRGK